jgi:hypothetical protein
MHHVGNEWVKRMVRKQEIKCQSKKVGECKKGGK